MSVTTTNTPVMSTATPMDATPAAPVAIKDLHVIMVLDESGSMSSIANDIVGSVNEFIKTQQEIKDASTMTLIKFSDNLQYVFKTTPFDKLKPLTNTDYKPNGTTALYDAIGEALSFGDARACVVVVTDGQENASKKFNKGLVKELMDKKKTDGWNFIFLSADLDTAAQGDAVGMSSAAFGAATQVNNVALGYEGLAAGISKKASAAMYSLRSNGVMRGMGSS